MSDHRRGSLFAACGLYLLASAGLWLVGLFGGGLFSFGTTEQRSLMIDLIYYVPFLFVPVLLWATRDESRLKGLRLNPIGLGTTIRTTIIALACVMIAENLSILWSILWQKLGLNVLMDTYVRPTSTSELTLSVLGVALITPVAEEMLFRGMILSSWEPRGARRAVLASTLLFALLHGSLLGLPAELFGGMMLALMVLWTDSLYTGMIFHGAYNATLVILQYVSTSPGEAVVEQADLLSSIGGPGGLLLVAMQLLFMVGFLFLLCGRPMAQYMMRSGTDIQRDDDGRRVLSHRPGTLFAPKGPKPAPLALGEVLMLMAGAVSSGAMMVIDILSMLGG